MKASKPAKVSESQIQRSILDYLAARHILAFRMQSGATMSSYGGKTRMIRYGTPGMADILAFVQPSECDYPHGHQRVYWIECKTEKGKQSELQKSFQAQVDHEGHRYGVCRSIEDVEDLLK